jgi:hypothetical protein
MSAAKTQNCSAGRLRRRRESGRRRGIIFQLLLHDFETVFLDHRIGQDFLGNALELRLRLIAVPAVEIKNEKFALANIGNLGIAQARERVLDGLSLRIEDRPLWHYPDVSFHEVSITFVVRPFRARRDCGVQKSAGALRTDCCYSLDTITQRIKS